MIGDIVGDYKIIEKVGQGGMGEVYKALHTKLDRAVAIKVLSSEYTENASMRKRFLNEARLQAKFTHPNVVNILNFFEIQNRAFLVMEYIEGETLEDLLYTRGILPIEEALSISYSVLNALIFMHSKGVIHRDIKPSNIMFTRQGEVKVTDFGIAKSINDKIKYTKTGLLGSVIYVSPEQILGEDVSQCTDIYSFGITLYRMLTGKSPFKGETEYTILKSHLEDKPIPPNNYNSVISKSLNKMILKAISKDSNKRYSSALEFSQKLRSSNRDSKGMSINMPDLSGVFGYIGSTIRGSIPIVLIILFILCLLLMFRFMPTISLSYLYIKQYLIELYLSVL